MIAVTCLTVTRATPDRLPRLAAAIAAFEAQGWPARRMLIAVDPRGGDPEAVRRMVAGHERIRVIAPAAATLGGLRNAARDAADTPLVCQWDDDDLHHPDRLRAQIATLGDAPAVALADVLHLFEAERTLFWTNWAATDIGAHPGTLLARRDIAWRYPETGPEAHAGEDRALAMALRGAGALATLAGAPHLYVYVAHGANISSAAHHRMLAQTLGISQALMRRREAAVRAGLAGTDLGGAVTACGPNGAAFTLGPRG